jgi:hypothetical protein
LDNSFNLEKESNDKLKINEFENIMDNVWLVYIWWYFKNIFLLK